MTDLIINKTDYPTIVDKIQFKDIPNKQWFMTSAVSNFRNVYNDIMVKSGDYVYNINTGNITRLLAIDLIYGYIPIQKVEINFSMVE